jgi:hypothetical protein
MWHRSALSSTTILSRYVPPHLKLGRLPSPTRRKGLFLNSVVQQPRVLLQPVEPSPMSPRTERKTTLLATLERMKVKANCVFTFRIFLSDLQDRRPHGCNQCVSRYINNLSVSLLTNEVEIH